jgi:hypothetical protein
MTRVLSRSAKTVDSMKELNACTEEELEQVLAGLLVQAGKVLLNDTEVEEFWQVHLEIQRRRGTAA